jgi:pimeloyl-ACP methyl ester carboxylesterase
LILPKECSKKTDGATVSAHSLPGVETHAAKYSKIGSQYADVEAKLATLPVISVSTLTLDGEDNGIIPASDGRSSAAKFSGRRIHHRVPNAGYALPQQAPKVFADAVMEVTKV